MRNVRTLARAIWKGFIRDRMAMFFTLLFPVLFLVIFGGLLNTDAPRTKLAQVGDVELIDSMRGDGRVQFEHAVQLSRDPDLAHAVKRVADGKIDGAIEQHGNQVILHYSQADRVKSATLLGLLNSVIEQANLDATGQPPTFVFAPQQVEDKSLTAIQFFTPGLLGWAVASSATFGAGLTLVLWRTRKVLRRLRLAPITPGSVVAARVIVSLLVALIQGALFIGLGKAFFDLQLRGSWWMAGPLLVAGTLAFLALGLLVGALAKTQEAAQAASQLIVMPMAFLAGSFFPVDDAPAAIKTLSRILPLRYLNDGMLDVLVRGKGPSAALVPMLALLAFAVVLTAISTRVFRWDTD